MANNSNDPQVSDAQAAVIRLLLEGKTQRAAAEEVGVSEFTVSRWANTDPIFMATLGRARLDVWEAHSQELANLLTTARETLAGVVRDPDADLAVRLKAALAILDLVKRPAGPLTIEDAEIIIAEKDRERWDRGKRARVTDMDRMLASMS